MTAYRTEQNTEYNSTEIYFDTKPTDEERTALKAIGCRWHSVKKCWYTRKTAAEVADALGSAPAAQGKGEKQPAKLPALTLDTLPKAKEIKNGGLYDGWEGANAHKWSGRDELKTLLLGDFKRAGIRATVRTGRCGYDTKLTVSVRVSPDEIKTFDEWREEYGGDDLNFIYSLYHFGWIDYRETDDEPYKNIHCDALQAMPTDEREKLCRTILQSTYRRYIGIVQDVNTYYQKSESVLTKAAADRLTLAKAIVNTYNHDCSNSMIDYFDRWIYDDYCVKIA